MKENSSDDDKALVTGLRKDAVPAFQRLYEKYSHRLYAFAMGYLNDSAEAEEIVQEVFLKIWSNRETLDPGRSFNAFLFTMAKNAILNIIRKSNHRQTFLNYMQLCPQKDFLLEEELNYKELESLYQKAIEKLSPKRRQVFRLSREQHLSNIEIADHLGVSVKTVENHMTAALSDIRNSLGRSGYTGFMAITLFL